MPTPPRFHVTDTPIKVDGNSPLHFLTPLPEDVATIPVPPVGTTGEQSNLVVTYRQPISKAARRNMLCKRRQDIEQALTPSSRKMVNNFETRFVFCSFPDHSPTTAFINNGENIIYLRDTLNSDETKSAVKHELTHLYDYMQDGWGTSTENSDHKALYTEFRAYSRQNVGQVYSQKDFEDIPQLTNPEEIEQYRKMIGTPVKAGDVRFLLNEDNTQVRVDSTAWNSLDEYLDQHEIWDKLPSEMFESDGLKSISSFEEFMKNKHHEELESRHAERAALC